MPDLSLETSIKELQDQNAATEAALSEKVMEVDMKKMDLDSLHQDLTNTKAERTEEIKELQKKIAEIDTEYEACKENIGPKKPLVDEADESIRTFQESLCNVDTSITDLGELLEHYDLSISIAKHKCIETNAAFDQVSNSITSHASLLESAMQELKKVQELERKCSRGALAELKAKAKMDGTRVKSPSKSVSKTTRKSALPVKKEKRKIKV